MSARDVFAEGGPLASKFPGYRPRAGQVAMAEAVERAIAKEDHLVVEGPTGTGKGLAYLVPAIEHALGGSELDQKRREASSRRVIVVTANIALQEQLHKKDLPSLVGVVPPFEHVMIKGRNNYLCLSAKEKVASQGALFSDPEIGSLLAWAEFTETGDISELERPPSPAMWRRLSVAADECKGSHCKNRKECFAERARRGAMRAHVIVTNYHLFFAHLKVREAMRRLRDEGAQVELDVVLPPADVIVFDEAHKAEEIAREFLGVAVAEGGVRWAVSKVGNPSIEARLDEKSQRFFSAARELRESRDYRARLKENHRLIPLGEQLAEELRTVARAYSQQLASTSWSQDEQGDLRNRKKRCNILADALDEAMHPEKKDDWVYYLEEQLTGKGEKRVSVRSKPLDPSPWLRDELFEQFKTVVLTSATMATSGGPRPFAYVRKGIGLDPNRGDDLVVESPFDWSTHAMLVIPKTMPDPKEDKDGFGPAVADHCVDIASEAGGRTLCLFTSYKNMREAAREMKNRLAYKVLAQGEKPRTMLVEEFKKDVQSCLLGCESFWAGVDVPGEACSVVIIDRLPFVTPDDPVADAMSDRNDRYFFEHSVPRAVIQLKQGMGRLLRSENDRGVVVVLDRRLTGTGYGRQILGALPKMRAANEVEDVGRFLSCP